MFSRQKVINIALAEEGYLEKKTNSQLGDKTANAGQNNWTKYAQDLDLLNFYNGKKNGYSWCDIFVDWCFVQAYGKANALKLLCQADRSAGASCTASAGYYKAKGQYYDKPQVGDQIFFGTNGKYQHTGLVYKVDASRVYTVEGNTSSAAGMVENGGCVRKKSYLLTYQRIMGYGRPDYGDTFIPAANNTIKTVKDVQIWLNGNYKAALTPDGLYGSLTKKALVKALQTELGVASDGIYGAKTNAAVKTLKAGSKGTLVKILQCFLICRKQKITADGDFGEQTELAVRIVQKHYKIDNDGIAGKMTFKALCS